MRCRFVAFVGIALGLALAMPSASAWAHGTGSGGAQLPPDAEPVAPEGKKARELLAALPQDEPSKALVASAVKKSNDALGRAHGAHLAGDREGAVLLSRVALAWAQAATAAVRAAESEKKAAASESKTLELKGKLDRARALLAETEARKLQLAAEVAKAEQNAQTLPASSSKEPAKKDPKKDKAKDPKPAKKEEPKKPAQPAKQPAGPPPPSKAEPKANDKKAAAPKETKKP